MFTNRFLLVISILSLLLVSLAAINPISNDPVDTSLPPRPDYSHLDEKPVLIDPNDDYYQRHPELRPAAGSTIDTTDYFFRHPELRISTNSVDLTDTYFRHPSSGGSN